jgi:hypothetical protein
MSVSVQNDVEVINDKECTFFVPVYSCYCMQTNKQKIGKDSSGP